MPRTTRRSNSPVPLTKIHTIIDGGYLSWVYGSQPRFFRGWVQKRMSYLDDTLVMIDSRSSIRRSTYPAYKANRQERREKSETIYETYLRVKEFESLLRSDPALPTIEVEGFEADDLIAWFWLKHPTVRRVIAVDKDFLQVPQLTSRMVDAQEKPKNYLHSFLEKFPKGAGPRRTFLPRDAIVLQVAFGDRSDNIPRLYPVGEVDKFYDRIWATPNPLISLVRLTSFEFVFTNLLLALIPSPFLREDYVEIQRHPDYLLELATSGEYWDPTHWPEFPALTQLQEDSHIMAKKVATPKVVEIVELWSQEGLEPKPARQLRREVVSQFLSLYQGESGELGEVEKVHGGDWTIPVGDQVLTIHTEDGTMTITGPETLAPYFTVTDEVQPAPTKGKQKAAPEPEPVAPQPKKGKKAPEPEPEEEEEEDEEEEPAPPKKAARRSPKA